MTVRVRRRPGRPVGGQPVVDRDLLLDAAERVIRAEGAGASLEAIAVEAGVTKPIVYARVGSRADLANALAHRLSDRLVSAAGTAMGGRRFSRITLAALIRASLETIGEHRELFFYVTRGTGDDTPQRTLYLAERSTLPLADLLTRWRAHHDLDTNVAMPWAYAIIGMLNLVSLWWINEPDRSAAALADQMAELLWPGLAVESAATAEPST